MTWEDKNTGICKDLEGGCSSLFDSTNLA